MIDKLFFWAKLFLGSMIFLAVIGLLVLCIGLPLTIARTTKAREWCTERGYSYAYGRDLGTVCVDDQNRLVLPKL